MKKIFFRSCLTMLLVLAVTTIRAQRIIMKVQAQTSGAIRDASTDLELLNYSFDMDFPRDPATGGASGRIKKSPLTITKKMGASSVAFFQAMVANETIVKVTIEIHEPNIQGVDRVTERILLEDGSIISFKQSTMQDIKSPVDEIRFVYRKITITAVDAGRTAQNDWNTN